MGRERRHGHAGRRGRRDAHETGALAGSTPSTTARTADRRRGGGADVLPARRILFDRIWASRSGVASPESWRPTNAQPTHSRSGTYETGTLAHELLAYLSGGRAPRRRLGLRRRARARARAVLDAPPDEWTLHGIPSRTDACRPCAHARDARPQEAATRLGERLRGLARQLLRCRDEVPCFLRCVGTSTTTRRTRSTRPRSAFDALFTLQARLAARPPRASRARDGSTGSISRCPATRAS